ncbi:MAG: Hpt domain-containing protein [Patescibacteria group bacterium]
MTDLSEYKELYIRTATELIQNLQQDFGLYMNNSADDAVIERLHRNFHSLKGQSLVMGYQNTGLQCKKLELIFREIKEKKLAPTDRLKQSIAVSIQNIYDSIESIKNNDKELVI